MSESKATQDRLGRNIDELSYGMAEISQLVNLLHDEQEALGKSGGL